MVSLTIDSVKTLGYTVSLPLNDGKRSHIQINEVKEMKFYFAHMVDCCCVEEESDFHIADEQW